MQPHGVITLLSLVLKINSLKVAVINRPGTLPYHLHSLSWGVVSGVGNERGLTACPQHARAHHSSATTGLCFATCMQSWMFPLLESGWYPVYTEEWYCFNQLSKDLTSVWPQYSWGRLLWWAESDEQGSGTAALLLPTPQLRQSHPAAASTSEQALLQWWPLTKPAAADCFPQALTLWLPPLLITVCSAFSCPYAGGSKIWSQLRSFNPALD